MLLPIHLREVYEKEVGVIALFQDGETKRGIEFLKVIQCERAGREISVSVIFH